MNNYCSKFQQLSSKKKFYSVFKRMRQFFFKYLKNPTMEKEVEVAILVQMELGVERGLVQVLDVDFVQVLQMETMDLVQKAQDLEKFCALIHSDALLL